MRATNLGQARLLAGEIEYSRGEYRNALLHFEKALALFDTLREEVTLSSVSLDRYSMKGGASHNNEIAAKQAAQDNIALVKETIKERAELKHLFSDLKCATTNEKTITSLEEIYERARQVYQHDT